MPTACNKGLLDPATGQLVYFNAGHEEPLVLSSSGIKCHLARTGRSVGVMPDSIYQAASIQLERGETLLLLTDGVSDAQNENGEAWSREKLMALLSQLNGDTANSLLQHLAAAVHTHIGAASQFDDITLMAIRRGE